jgi:hypothetical protein
MPLTSAQLAARRQNAQKSTGPRTPEGKQNSRANALKHGLRAQTAFRPEDEHAIERRTADFAADLGPQGPCENHLVRQIAWASLRLERLQNEDEHAHKNRRTAAFDTLANDYANRAVALIESLKRDDPPRQILTIAPGAPTLDCTPPPIDRAALIAKLESTTDGCAQLADLWDALAAIIDDPAQTWLPFHVRMVARLLAHTGPVTPASPSEIIEATRAALAIALKRTQDPKHQSALLDLLDQATGQPTADLPAPERFAQAITRALPRPDHAAADLKSLAQLESDRLSTLMEDVWNEHDAPALEEAANAATNTTDTSPESQLRHRYLRAATQDLHRAFRLLAQGRRTRLWSGNDNLVPYFPNEPKPSALPSPTPSAPPAPSDQSNESYQSENSPPNSAPNEPKPATTSGAVSRSNSNPRPSLSRIPRTPHPHPARAS